MPPLCSLEVEGVAHVHDQQDQDNQEEAQPWQQEFPSPSSNSMTGKAVTKCGYGGKDTKKSTEHDHLVPVVQLVGQSHGDQGNP